MKRLFLGRWLFIASLLFLTAPNVVAEENLLNNPGFEKGSAGWSEWNSTSKVVDGKVSTEQFHSGTYSGKRWFVNPAELTYSCFIQVINIKINKGDTISVSSWMMSPPEDPLRNGAEAFLVIEFWRGAEKIAYPESERLNGQTKWKEFEVSGVVPEGTDLVKVCCFLFGFKGSKGTVYFDDLKAEIKSK